MKSYFLGILFVSLFSSIFAFSEDTTSVNQNWTHYVEDVDWNTKVILLNDGSSWGLVEGFEEGLTREVRKPQKKNKKGTIETISHKKGYPLLESSLWRKGKKLKITPVYLDENGLIIQPRYLFGLHKKTPYCMFDFFVGKVESTIQPGTYIPRYVSQGPFVVR